MSITDKYKNYKYKKDIKDLITSTRLDVEDIEKLDEIYLKYKEIKKAKVYEPIIRDLFILACKKELSTSYLAEIYNTGLRTMQLWLKDLGLNRHLKTSFKYRNNEENIAHYKRIKEIAKSNYKGKMYCIYRFLDKNNEVLYIGKCTKSFHYDSSKNGVKDYFLKERLIQHFSPSSKSPKSLYLNTKRIEVIYPNVKSNNELEALESALISYYERNFFQCKYNKDLNLSYTIKEDCNEWTTYHELTSKEIKELLKKYNYKTIPKIEITNERLNALIWYKKRCG